MFSPQQQPQAIAQAVVAPPTIIAAQPTTRSTAVQPDEHHEIV